MTSKERVKIAISRNIPDRIPMSADFVPEARKLLMDHFKTNDYFDMLVKLGCDMLVAGAGIGTSFYGEGEEYICPWGCKWKYFRNDTGSYTSRIEHPLADDYDGSKLAAYSIPDPDADNVVALLRDVISRYGKSHFICGFLACTIFEASWYLQGLQDTIMDMVERPDYVNTLFDKVMEYPRRAGLRFIDEGVDMIWLGDDVGMQHGMMISTDTWREFLKPRLKELIDVFKSKNPEILIAYHSCGYIIPIIDELIEIGVDVLNPIQPHAMDPAVIKKQFGDRLSFWGAIDIQNTLPNGSVQQIRDEVLLRRNTIGEGGGYIMGPAHNVQSDTSIENVLALFAAAKELAIY
jgi:uroporphyrinogen decarboxylase